MLLYHRRLLLSFVHRFSFLQQYLIVLSISAVIVVVIGQWWCVALLPLSTVLTFFITKGLTRVEHPPLALSGHFYDLLVRAQSTKQTNHSNTIDICDPQQLIDKECDRYIRTIVERYLCVWYYPLISTDQEFPQDLTILLNMVLNRVSDRLKYLNYHDIVRLVFNLHQTHMHNYLRTLDSYRKQRKANRTSKSLMEEFSQLIGVHRALRNGDTHAYLKAIVELILTEFLPESFHAYGGSPTCREFLTQIIVNCIFVPVIDALSKPQMIYHLIVLLWETDEQRKAAEDVANEFSASSIFPSSETNQTETEPAVLTEYFGDQLPVVNERRGSILERIIYTATIVSCDRAYNQMSGAAFTVYFLQCETKSPFTSNAVHRYVVRRRFREFINLHKRLKQNPVTARHISDFDDPIRYLPMIGDNMNPEVIHRRRLVLEEYIQKIITNDVLNSSHDVLGFFAYNSDPNVEFELLPPSKLPVPRVDRVLLRTLSGVSNKLNSLLPSKREIVPLRETFQLHVSTTYTATATVVEQIQLFIHQSSLRYSSQASMLHPNDVQLQELLLTRSSITAAHRKQRIQSDLPLTDALLNLLHTSLHSREATINFESVHQILRTVFGRFIEKFLKDQIDELISHEQILLYLILLRTEVLWPVYESPILLTKNGKHRAYNACINIIPSWLRQIIGVEHVQRIVTNAFQCFSYEVLNRHLIYNLLDLLLEQLVPTMATKDFLTKYVQMHAGSRP